MKKIMFNDKYGLTQAVIDGRKTQTRRICREQVWAHSDLVNAGNGIFHFEQPRYGEGEVVAVAQSYRYCGGVNEGGVPLWEIISQNVDGTNAGWSNKMFVRADLMPYKIRITHIRVERLQDISEEDCLKEGIIKGRVGSEDTHFMTAYYVPTMPLEPYCTAREAFEFLIEKVCGKSTWNKNPYVFVYDFELVK